MPTEILRPNGVGDETQLEVGDGSGDNWELVDEATPDGDSTSVIAANNDDTETDSYALQNTALTSETIDSIDVWDRTVDYNGSGQSFIAGVRLSSTNSMGPGSSRPDSGYINTETANLSRPGGGSWAVSDLNSLQVRVTMNHEFNANFWCTQVWVEVNYTAAETASIAGEVAAASAAAQQATITALRSASIVGEPAASTAASLEGSVAALRTVSVAGEPAASTSAGLQATVTAIRTVSVSGELASATSAGLAATITAVEVVSAFISGEIATADADALAGSVQLATSIAGEAATATAAGLEATVTAIAIENISISGETAAATAAGLEATITTVQTASISGELAAATAEALEAVVSILTSASISGELATATAAANAGTITTKRLTHGNLGTSLTSAAREIAPVNASVVAIPREIRPVTVIRPIQRE